MRSEQTIVYATLRDLILSYPPLADLEEIPRIVFDYTPESITAGDNGKRATFPAVGVSQVGNVSHKLIDKHEDYCRTQDDAGIWYVWREAGRFSMTCQVALFVSATEKIYNPVVFLRGWAEYVEKMLIDQLSFRTSADCIEGERIILSATARGIEQLGKLMHAKKLTIEARGKYLVSSKLQEPTETRRPRIVVSAQLD